MSTNSVLDELRLERDRQRKEWGDAHDDEHEEGELADAGGCYAIYADVHVPTAWPWDEEWWRPKTRRRNLIRAAALIIAEIEKMDRIDDTPEPADFGVGR